MKFYHYPKCSTCVSGLEKLKQEGIDPEIILYCEIGITKEEIVNLIKLLNLKTATDLIKKNGLSYRYLGLSKCTKTEEEWIETIIQNPKLLKRPIIATNNSAIIFQEKKLEEFNNFIKNLK